MQTPWVASLKSPLTNQVFDDETLVESLILPLIDLMHLLDILEAYIISSSASLSKHKDKEKIGTGASVF